MKIWQKYSPKVRAFTFLKKVKVIVRLLILWQKNPQLRLGQLIVTKLPEGYEQNLFFVEDQILIELLERKHK